MANDFKINTLFEIAFGTRDVALFRNPSTDQRADSPDHPFGDVTVVENVQQASRLSYLGTPVIFPITFKGKKYQVYNDRGEITLEAFETFELPVAVFVEFRQPTIIRRTKILGSRGTVKELYGDDDWSVDIKGVCLDDPSHAYAKTAMQQHEALVNWKRVKDAIAVEGELFYVKGIRNIVIEDIRFGQIPGKPNTMPFTIRAKSDEPEELILQ